MRLTTRFSFATCFSMAMLATRPSAAAAQNGGGWVRPESVPAPAPGTPTVTVEAGAHYDASAFHRFLLGGAYRDLWTTPIRVPVLNLETFAGGLRSPKLGGGNQTKSLHFTAADGTEYDFRSVDKDEVGLPDMWKGGVVERIAHDMTSDAQPAGMLVVPSILDAAGVLHVTPVLMVMPDDPALGGFRAQFAGRLGDMEIDPKKPKKGEPGFAGAVDIIDSDTLLRRLDSDPATRIDAPTFLTARLVDMLMNDWDRAPDQWKWARFGSAEDALWEPIPRDRDKAMISTSGFITGLMGMAVPGWSLIKFNGTYPPFQALTVNSAALDERLLSGLEKPVWDSVARTLQQRITDSVITAALAAMPPEYQRRSPEFARKLRERRDGLTALADRYYRLLARVVDVHGTDAADRAVITRVDDLHVDVTLQSGSAAPDFTRRFDARETAEIRIYLHGGDDSAVVRGNVKQSIVVRIIGGNGTNHLVDSSTVDGRNGTARLYDAGTVRNVTYGVDTIFDRRPFPRQGGVVRQPVPDYGGHLGPTANLDINHDYGIEPELGLRKVGYGFDEYPYSSVLALDGIYSLKLTRYQLGLSFDKRFELSPLHVTGLARVSELELINFHGYGNQAPQSDTNFYIARQSQRLFQPAIALTLSPAVELSLSAVIQQSVTDTTSGHFVSDSQPYGYGTNGQFGEAGLQFNFHLDSRDQKRHAHHGNVVDLTARYFPGLWDAKSPFGSVEGLVAQYITFPIPTHPFLALRAGGTKVFGDFPFQEAAFLGGNTTIRTLYPQSYAGDAVVYGTAELRIPVAKFTVIMPLNTGLLATEDVGRVYVKGASPGGMHYAFGAGFWIGFHELTADIRVMQAEDGQPTLIGFQLVVPTRPYQ